MTNKARHWLERVQELLVPEMSFRFPSFFRGDGGQVVVLLFTIEEVVVQIVLDNGGGVFLDLWHICMYVCEFGGLGG